MNLVSSTSERIKIALELKGMKQSELVEKTGIGKSSISTYLSGGCKPKQDNLLLIARTLDVNDLWLMGYDVSIEPKNFDKSDDTRFNEQDKALINTYNNFEDLDKRKLSNIIDDFKLLNSDNKDKLVERSRELLEMQLFKDKVGKAMLEDKINNAQREYIAALGGGIREVTKSKRIGKNFKPNNT